MKLDRANQHLEDLNNAVQGFLDSKPYDTIVEFDPETGENVLRLKAPVGPDQTLSLIVGDVLFNLKSPLDHLVYALAAKNGSTRLDDSEFPIFASKTLYDGGQGARKKIPDIGSGAQAVVERLQPYNRPTEPARDWDPLWLLYELHRRDKHRTLHIVGAAVHGVGLAARMGLGINSFRMRSSFAVFEDGAEVVRWSNTAFPDYSNVDVYRDLRCEVFFDPTSAMTPELPVSLILREIRGYIQVEVFPPLEAFL